MEFKNEEFITNKIMIFQERKKKSIKNIKIIKHFNNCNFLKIQF